MKSSHESCNLKKGPMRLLEGKMEAKPRGKLVVVEDEDCLREMLTKNIVAKHGFEILTTSNGREALDIVLTKSPDAVITDLCMPDMDGLQLLRAIRDKGLDTPVLMVTGYPSPKVLETAMQLGAYKFISKPCNTDEITNSAAAAVRFGLILKEVNVEVAAACAKCKLTGEDLVNFGKARKAFLLQQKLGHIPKDEKPIEPPE